MYMISIVLTAEFALDGGLVMAVDSAVGPCGLNGRLR
jgi:hypothetical protein